MSLPAPTNQSAQTDEKESVPQPSPSPIAVAAAPTSLLKPKQDVVMFPCHCCGKKYFTRQGLRKHHLRNPQRKALAMFNEAHGIFPTEATVPPLKSKRIKKPTKMIESRFNGAIYQQSEIIYDPYFNPALAWPPIPPPNAFVAPEFAQVPFLPFPTPMHAPVGFCFPDSHFYSEFQPGNSPPSVQNNSTEN
ncbi:hypothetical protein HK098_002295 [Nowakowskiella sp. JEL0407]|nr:hypothetical protein HK098_002295 [Nowakowskiella sp. JEL0407]